MPISSHCCDRGVPLSHCCGLVVAFACGRGACWACWGTVSLRSWANFWRSWKVWRVWGLANGSLERLEKKPLLRPWGALEPSLWPCGGFCLQRWAWQGFKKDRIHTSGGPRRRPGLGEGRGRRTLNTLTSHLCYMTFFFSSSHGLGRTA